MCFLSSMYSAKYVPNCVSLQPYLGWHINTPPTSFNRVSVLGSTKFQDLRHEYNTGQKPGGRKKRLVDSAAMGAPLPYNPYTPQMAPGVAPNMYSQPPPYTQGNQSRKEHWVACTSQMAPNMAPGVAPNMYSQPPPYTQGNQSRKEHWVTCTSQMAPGVAPNMYSQPPLYTQGNQSRKEHWVACTSLSLCFHPELVSNNDERLRVPSRVPPHFTYTGSNANQP
uniref:(California timema) hypothetical protein n=1 Tax=Timema californicum TaxID=61474 RepID=A0A7R9JFW8_TIMCA|nr:unnamed protein product [Timema californicum]